LKEIARNAAALKDTLTRAEQLEQEETKALASTVTCESYSVYTQLVLCRATLSAAEKTSLIN